MSEDIFLSPLPVGHLLLTLACQSTLWLALGLTASRLLRRRAARGHLVLVLMSTAAILSPVSTLAVRHMDWGLLPARQSAADISATPAPPPSLPRFQESESAGVRQAVHLLESASQAQVSNISDSPIFAANESTSSANGTDSTARFDKYVPAALAGCWLVASLVLTARLAVSLRAGRRIARAARVETSPALLTALRETARALGLRSAPDLRVSARAQCPMIWCWGSRPVLLVPESAAQNGGVNWRSVFCHELAHLVRRDHWSALWAEVLVIALPWQPLAWRSRRRLAFLREQSCDDWVLAAGGDATDYAKSLLQLVPQRSPAHALAAVSSRTSLKERLEHMLTGARVAPRIGRRWLATSVVAALAVIAGVALAQPRRQRLEPAVGTSSPSQPGSMSQSHSLVLSGSVVNEKGEPVAGARVAAIVHLKAVLWRGGDPLGGNTAILAQTITDPNGAFRATLEGVSSLTQGGQKVIASADGYGLAWEPFDLAARSATKRLRLAKEQVIRGRVSDLQGQPADRVRMRVATIWWRQTGDAKADAGRLSAAEERFVGVSGKAPAAWPDVVVSDANGSFEIRKVSARHGVVLNVDGDERFAPQRLQINMDVKREGRGWRPDAEVNVKPGQPVTLPLVPAQFAEGVLRFSDTGQPAAKARVAVWASETRHSGSSTGASGLADDRGRFRISCRQGTHFRVVGFAPDNTPYLNYEKTIDVQAGVARVPVDIDLPRGVLVQGQVVEAGSNKPVAGATVQYIPESKALRASASKVVTRWEGRQFSDSGGRFAIAVLPGRGHLLVHAPLNEYVPKSIGAEELAGLGQGGQRNYAHGIERIDVVAGSPPTSVTISLVPGATVSGRLVSPNGNPVDQALMLSRLQDTRANLIWHAFPEAVYGGEFTLSGCTPGDETSVYFFEPQARLGATARLRADRLSEPAVVRLAPCGTIKIRLVDSAGQPVAHRAVEPSFVMTPGADWSDRPAMQRGKLVADRDNLWNIDGRDYGGHRNMTDAEGRVTLPAFIPGATYDIYDQANGQALKKNIRLRAGETLDLGDVEVKKTN